MRVDRCPICWDSKPIGHICEETVNRPTQDILFAINELEKIVRRLEIRVETLENKVHGLMERE